MSHPLEESTAAGTPSTSGSGGGSLARAELHRLTARRLVRWLVVLSALGFLAVWVISLTQFARPSPELLQEAEQRRAQLVEQEREVFCGDGDPGLPEEEREAICADISAENYGPVESFLPKQPFDAAGGLPGGAIAVGVAVSALAFLVGATYAGAEWSTKSIVALLFWEPRRIRVFLTKLAVLLGVVAVFAALAQLVWLGAGSLLARWRGSFELPDGFWSDLAGVQGRGVVLAVLTAALGFGLANLIRNTGAALGVAFAYFVLAENAVRIIRQSWQPYLITENAVALLQRGGLEIFLPVEESGEYFGGATPRLLLGNQRAALTLAVYCLVVLLAGVVLFRRRDLT